MHPIGYAQNAQKSIPKRYEQADVKEVTRSACEVFAYGCRDVGRVVYNNSVRACSFACC